MACGGLFCWKASSDSLRGIKSLLGRCRWAVAFLALGVCLSLSFGFGVLGVNWFFLLPHNRVVVRPILRAIDFPWTIPLTVGPCGRHLKLQWIYHPPHGGMAGNDAGFDAFDEVFSRLLDLAIQPVSTASQDRTNGSFGIC